MNPNQSDLKWLSEQLRAEFDKPYEFCHYDRQADIINRAIRFGLIDLAREMLKDIPSRETIEQSPATSKDSMFEIERPVGSPTLTNEDL